LGVYISIMAIAENFGGIESLANVPLEFLDQPSVEKIHPGHRNHATLQKIINRSQEKSPMERKPHLLHHASYLINGSRYELTLELITDGYLFPHNRAAVSCLVSKNNTERKFVFYKTRKIYVPREIERAENDYVHKSLISNLYIENIILSEELHMIKKLRLGETVLSRQMPGNPIFLVLRMPYDGFNKIDYILQSSVSKYAYIDMYGKHQSKMVIGGIVYYPKIRVRDFPLLISREIRNPSNLGLSKLFESEKEEYLKLVDTLMRKLVRVLSIEREKGMLV